MAVSPLKTWIAGEVLTASDLNAEFLHVYDGGQSLGWPATTSKDFDGNILILDADGDSTLTADTDDRLDIALSGIDLFRFDATVSTPVNGFDFIAAAASSEPSVTAVGSDTDIDVDLIPKGAGLVTSNGRELLQLESAQAILAQEFFS